MAIRDSVHELPGIRRRGPSLRTLIIVVLVLLILGARSIAELVVEYEWWKELGQLETWKSIIIYSFAPVAGATLVAFFVLWMVHARALKFAGTGLREHSLYAKAATLVLAFLSFLIARSSLNSWTIVSFYGSQRAGVAAGAWRDPIFSNPLSFYLFELPFYSQLLGLLLAISIVSVLLFYAAARGWQLVRHLPSFRSDGQILINPGDLMLAGGLES